MRLPEADGTRQISEFFGLLGNLTKLLRVPLLACALTASSVSAKDLIGGEQPVMLPPEEALKTFTLPPGYQINLFASETNFPIESPNGMTWDSRGRLWVINIPTHPHAKPETKPNDRIVILEDTDRDGVADKSTVFADGLYLPMGFAVTDGGRTAYCVSQPNLLRLTDTDDDGVADEREIVLHGFGTEDNHHVMSAFQWGPDGGLYMAQGLFLNSQVETPFGVTRAHEGAVFRYQPWDGRFDVYAQHDWSNPWGIIFDGYGKPFLADASPGLNYYMSPMATAYQYPQKDDRKFSNILSFTPSGRRPTCGAEFLQSRHFPKEVRDWYVVAQMKGFHGLRWYKLKDEGSNLAGEQPIEQELLTSTDTTFRPSAVQLGPDGALYVLDYYNPIVGHTTYNFRDPRRIQTHGRVWRITHQDGETLTQPKIIDESIPVLLDLLLSPELRTRYFARHELHQRSARKVRSATRRWAGKDERRALEAIWVLQGIGSEDDKLLNRVLDSSDPELRAAGLRALRFLQEEMRESKVQEILNRMIGDEHPRVRLEALVATSHHANRKAALVIAAKVLEMPLDDGLTYASKETFSFFDQAGVSLPDAVVDFMIPHDSDARLANRDLRDSVANEMLRRSDVEADTHTRAASFLAQGELMPFLLNQLRSGDKRASVHRLLLSQPVAALRAVSPQLKDLAKTASSGTARAHGLAALAKTADGLETLAAVKLPYDILTAAPLMGRSGSHPELFASVKRLLAKGTPKSTRLAAIKAASYFPVNDPEAVELLVGVADETRTSDLTTSFAALAALKKIPAEKWSAEYGNRILTKLTIEATPDLKFAPTEFSVPAGSAVELTLFNPDNMYHNLVIVKPDAADAVGTASELMSAQPNGLEKHYVPAVDGILHFTPQLGLRRRHTLRFYAPDEPGDYPYLCTYPGHWRVMRGIMRVTNP